MKRKYFALAMGIAAAVMAGGCSGQAADTKTEAAQTEAEQPESSTMSDSEKESYYAAQDLGSQEEEGPLKIAGTILEVGEDSILVDSDSEAGYVGELMLMIDPDSTLVLDGVNGLPVELKDVGTGYFEAYLGPAMTMSLPAQSTPYAVIVNIPEGEAAPQYVVAAGKVDEVRGKQTLTGMDEAEYPLARNVEISPYLTKNIVQLEDIGSGSRCLVWMNEEAEVDRIVLFGE